VCVQTLAELTAYAARLAATANPTAFHFYVQQGSQATQVLVRAFLTLWVT